MKPSSAIMEKIRKCLNLGDINKGATEHEAAAAMAAAKKLMAEYNLSMSDVEVKEEARAGATEAADGIERKDRPVWEQYMARVADNLFGTKHYFSHGLNKKGAMIRRVKFVGTGVDAAIAAEAYTILVNLVWDMAYGHGYTGKEHKSYCMGVANTLHKRSQDSIKEVTPAQEERGRGIMVIKNQVIESHLNKLGLRPMRRSNPSVASEAYNHGKADGRNVNMDFRKALR